MDAMKRRLVEVPHLRLPGLSSLGSQKHVTISHDATSQYDVSRAQTLSRELPPVSSIVGEVDGDALEASLGHRYFKKMQQAREGSPSSPASPKTQHMPLYIYRENNKCPSISIKNTTLAPLSPQRTQQMPLYINTEVSSTCSSTSLESSLAGGFDTPPTKTSDAGYSYDVSDVVVDEAQDDLISALDTNIPGGGVAGQDYPILASVPDTGFSCEDQQFPGYYADTADEAGCQVFHICQLDGRLDSFLCPNGTVFNQQYFVCDWWYNVDCSASDQFRSLNAEIGKIPEGNEASISSYGTLQSQEQLNNASEAPAQQYNTQQAPSPQHNALHAPAAQYNAPQAPSQQYNAPQTPSQRYSVSQEPAQQYNAPQAPSQQYNTQQAPSHQYSALQAPAELHNSPKAPSQQYNVPQIPSQQHNVPQALSQQYKASQDSAQTYNVPQSPSQQYSAPQAPSQQYIAQQAPSQQYNAPQAPSQQLNAPPAQIPSSLYGVPKRLWTQHFRHRS
ncbi:uncharacterized protein [Panulirus ornatus]|uniref:uncharacterized protein n=1 Tax=Panulirus ornatus TaxID=150431 RepID=UPI003A85914B